MTGQEVTTANGLNELLRLKQALIMNMKDPQPGQWTLKVTADGPHTVRVTGLSSLDFVHGFSKNFTLDLGLTQHRPISGKCT